MVHKTKLIEKWGIKMQFTKEQFEQVLKQAITYISMEIQNNVTMNDITELWSRKFDLDSREFVYRLGVENNGIHVILQSTIDIKTRVSKEEAVSIRIGFLQNLAHSRRYAEFGRLRRTSNLDTSLPRELKSALIESVRVAVGSGTSNVEWKELKEQAHNTAEIESQLSKKEGRILRAIPFTGRKMKVTKDLGNNQVGVVERLVNSLNGEKFVMFTNKSQEVGDLIVDTEKRVIVKATDEQGKDIKHLFSHLITEGDGLIATKLPHKKWIVRIKN